MQTTITREIARQIFEAHDRSYFSDDGIDALLEIYDNDCDFDAVGICCSWSEYGQYDCNLSYVDMVTDYQYLYSPEEYIQDYDITEDESGEYSLNDDDFDDYIDCLVRKIEKNTTVIRLPNRNFLIAEA